MDIEVFENEVYTRRVPFKVRSGNTDYSGIYIEEVIVSEVDWKGSRKIVWNGEVPEIDETELLERLYVLTH